MLNHYFETSTSAAEIGPATPNWLIVLTASRFVPSRSSNIFARIHQVGVRHVGGKTYLSSWRTSCP